MKISKEFFQFSKPSLVLVTGSHSAEIYYSYQGEIIKVDSFKTENPVYSDKEGFFTRAGGGVRCGSGSVLEINKGEILKKFVRELKSRIEKILQEKTVEEVFLFQPRHLKKIINDELDSTIKDREWSMIEGNFIGHHPFDLIKMIQGKIQEKKPILASESALKILKKKK